MAAKWRKCTRCSKVKAIGDFPDSDESAAVCTSCLTRPPRAPRRTADPAPAVPTRRVAPVRSEVGRGTREVRAGRARTTAQRQLAERHATQFAEIAGRLAAEGRGRGAALSALAEIHEEEYTELLRAARQAEGLEAFGLG